MNGKHLKKMNTDKLVKAIQIIVKEEIKLVLPKLVKEGVKLEMAKLLSESKKLREAVNPQTPKYTTFMDTDSGLDINGTFKNNKGRPLSNNPILNEILQETQPFSSPQRQSTGYGDDWNTMNFDSTSVNTLGQKSIVDKMGYGDMNTNPKPNGLGVKTGLAGLDKILNRDNSELIKAWDKKKGNWRPGME